MEAIDQVLEIISRVILNVIGNVVFYAFICAIIDIVLGENFVRKTRKNSWTERANKFWTFVAKTSYVLLPLEYMITDIFQGGIWGAHSITINVIDDSTLPGFVGAPINHINHFC